MSDKSSSSSSSGIGFFGLLTIVFIVLKLTHYIDWSWWWVLSPMLFWPALFLLTFLFAVAIKVLPIIFDQRRAYKARYGNKTKWFWQRDFWNVNK